MSDMHAMRVEYVASLDEMRKTVMKLTRELSSSAERQGLNVLGADVWFRGCARESYSLLPSLFRFASGVDAERQLHEEFRAFLPQISGWSTLFHMQHHFVPTRLLDWTANFNTALYFALNAEECAHPSIYI